MGIWSLCVRQLNTPGRARLVREMLPDTHAYNLEAEENGLVQVRRDVADEFSCCIPGLFRGSSSSSSSGTSTAEKGGESSCLRYLVQNSSLMFVEGFVTTVRSPPAVDAASAGASGRGEEAAEGRCFVRSDLPTVRRPSPCASTEATNACETPASSSHRTPNEPDDLPANKPVIRTCSDPALSPNPRPKPSSSPSVLSTRSCRGEAFQRTGSFLLNRVLLTDSPHLSKSLSGEGGHEEGSRLLSTEMCSSVFRTGISLQVKLVLC